MTNLPHLPFAVPDIGDEEIEAVVATLKSGWLTSGPRTAEFERLFGEYVEAPCALAVNSCTAGLHLALAALGIGPGDEVITTPLTFCATVNVILQCGARPVLADIGPDLNLDPHAIEAAATPATRAVIPVHIGGLPCDMDSIWGLAQKRGWRVVEDAAHAAGSRYRGVPIGGGSSDAVAFSFYATKNLTTGEGGMVTARSPELHDRMRMLCLHGIDHDAWNRYGEKGSWFYQIAACGFKYNLSDVAAAIGIPQLRRLDAMNTRRAEIAARYDAAFSAMDEIEIPPRRADSIHSWHLYAARLNLGKLKIDRGQFMAELKSRGIGASVHFIPIPLHPYYRETLTFRDPCDRALEEYQRLVSLPIYSKMTDAQVDRVIDAVGEVVSRASKQHAPAVLAREEAALSVEALS